MSELFMECEEEELEPWQRRIPEINLVDDDDDDDDEPIFVGEIRGCKAPRNIAPGPAPVVKSVNQRQVAPTATRSVMPVSPVMRSGGAVPTSPQRPQQTPAASSSTQSGSCSSSSGPIVPQLAVRAAAQTVPKSLLIPVASQPGSLPTVAQTASLAPQAPQPIIINNQGYLVTSPQITSNSTLIASLANQYPPGTSFTVLPAGQQLLPQVTPAKVVPGVIHRPQVQLIQNNVVTLANVQSPPQAKQFGTGKLQPVQMSATTLQPIQLVPSAVQGKIVTPPKPQGSPAAAAKQTSPSLQVMGSAGVGMNAGKRESPPDALTNATKRTKLELGVSNVPDFTQNGTPFRKKCPKCNIQFNLPDPMKSHMRYCCSHLIESVFPTTSRLGKPSTSVRMMDAERGKLIMLVTEFYYGRHEGDRMVHKEQKANVTFKCNSCLKVLKNNIRFMNHMKHHLELEKQSNESWDSHTTCQHCFRQYATPFQLQCHIESAHSPYESTTNCKICELAFETEQALLEHMKDNHKPGEMPYVCQVCNFRSSFFSEVETHFRAVHENTKDLLCPFCLKVLRSGHIYMQHYMRHQKKGIHRCGKCRLNFLTYKEKTEHKTQFHRTFKKPKSLEGLPPGTKVTIRASLLGSSPTSAGPPSKSFVIPSSPTSKLQNKPPSSSAKTKSTAQSSSTTRSRPYTTKKQERLNSRLQERSSEALRNIRFRNHLGPQKCLECYTKFTDFYSHYPMVLNCSACKYCTCCSKSYEHHMIRFHSAVSRDRFKKVKMPKGSLRSITLVCLNCDFLADASGTNLMSKHLIDRPHHNCQVIIEKGISSEEVSETGPEPEASSGEPCDSTRVESDVLSGDAGPSDMSGKKQENRTLDFQSDSSVHQTEPLQAKDSKLVLEKESKGGETPTESSADAKDGGAPEETEKKAPEPVERDAAPEPVERDAAPEPVERDAAPEPVERDAAPEPVERDAAPEPVERDAAPEPVERDAAPEPVERDAAPEPVERDAAPEPVERDAAPEPVERDAAPEPVERDAAPEPVERDAAPEPVEKDAAPEPVNEDAAPEPVNEDAAPEPVNEDAAPEPVEKDAAPEPVEKDAAQEPVEEDAAPEPVEEDAAPEPVEEDAAPEPVEEDAAPEPVEEDAAPEPVEEDAAPEPVEEDAAPEPVEEDAAPEPVEKGVAPEPVEKDASAGEPSGGNSPEKETREETLSEARASSGPADRETEEGDEVDLAKDDVPFEEFLTKADEGELESSDVGEDSSVHLEPLTPSKVLEHEATEILQKGGGSDPESKTGDPADDANDGSRPSSPDKSGDASA